MRSLKVTRDVDRDVRDARDDERDGASSVPGPPVSAFLLPETKAVRLLTGA